MKKKNKSLTLLSRGHYLLHFHLTFNSNREKCHTIINFELQKYVT